MEVEDGQTGRSGKESRGAGGGCRSPQQRTRSVASERGRGWAEGGSKWMVLR